MKQRIIKIGNEKSLKEIIKFANQDILFFIDNFYPEIEIHEHHRNFIELLELMDKKEKAKSCQHKNTEFRNDIPLTDCVEVCIDCGSSREHWEQGESTWINLPIEEVIKRNTIQWK